MKLSNVLFVSCSTLCALGLYVMFYGTIERGQSDSEPRAGQALTSVQTQRYSGEVSQEGLEERSSTFEEEVAGSTETVQEVDSDPDLADSLRAELLSDDEDESLIGADDLNDLFDIRPRRHEQEVRRRDFIAEQAIVDEELAGTPLPWQASSVKKGHPSDSFMVLNHFVAFVQETERRFIVVSELEGVSSEVFAKLDTDGRQQMISISSEAREGVVKLRKLATITETKDGERSRLMRYELLPTVFGLNAESHSLARRHEQLHGLKDRSLEDVIRSLPSVAPSSQSDTDSSVEDVSEQDQTEAQGV
ncbi:MAG: hypothetical protein KDD55_12230 [Bdellovibrionales bacterium]|nr:hypothetical protein [Bdellovibrionales bacterium]